MFWLKMAITSCLKFGSFKEAAVFTIVVVVAVVVVSCFIPDVVIGLLSFAVETSTSVPKFCSANHVSVSIFVMDNDQDESSTIIIFVKFVWSFRQHHQIVDELSSIEMQTEGHKISSCESFIMKRQQSFKVFPNGTANARNRKTVTRQDQSK
jgi:hypothetical protein